MKLMKSPNWQQPLNFEDITYKECDELRGIAFNRPNVTLMHLDLTQPVN